LKRTNRASFFRITLYPFQFSLKSAQAFPQDFGVNVTDKCSNKHEGCPKVFMLFITFLSEFEQAGFSTFIFAK
jgi:hypothetical protein